MLMKIGHVYNSHMNVKDESQVVIESLNTGSYALAEKKLDFSDLT